VTSSEGWWLVRVAASRFYVTHPAWFALRDGLGFLVQVTGVTDKESWRAKKWLEVGTGEKAASKMAFGLLAFSFWLLAFSLWALGFQLLALGFQPLGSWLSALGSWLSAFGSWRLAFSSSPLAVGRWLFRSGC
jgi:hypothetical protein